MDLHDPTPDLHQGCHSEPYILPKHVLNLKVWRKIRSLFRARKLNFRSTSQQLPHILLQHRLLSDDYVHLKYLL